MIVEARALQLSDAAPTAPFCSVEVGEGKGRISSAVPANAGRTAVWDFGFETLVHPAQTDVVAVRVWERQRLQRNTLLGECSFDVCSLVDEEVQDMWLPLQLAGRLEPTGHIRLMLWFTPVWYDPPLPHAQWIHEMVGAKPGHARPLLTAANRAAAAAAGSAAAAADGRGAADEPPVGELSQTVSDLCMASWAVYFDRPNEHLDAARFRVVQLSNRHSSQRYMMCECVNGDLIIAFQGSYSMDDTLVDMRISPTSDLLVDGTAGMLEGEVHAGFAERAATISLLPFVHALRPASADVPAKRLYFCGHSMGGAVASLVALRLVTQAMLSVGECRRVAVVSFGMPCFALEALSTAVAADPRTRDMFHVICNEHDVVCSIFSHPVFKQKRASADPTELADALSALSHAHADPPGRALSGADATSPAVLSHADAALSSARLFRNVSRIDLLDDADGGSDGAGAGVPGPTWAADGASDGVADGAAFSEGAPASGRGEGEGATGSPRGPVDMLATMTADVLKMYAVRSE